MGRAIHLLTNKQAESATGTLCDGGGLYLMRKGRGAAASWIFRFARQGKTHDLGLGPFPEISLKRARDKAFELRRKLAEGVDVLAERGRAEPAMAAVVAAPTAKTPGKPMTFAEAAAKYIAAQEAGWTKESTFQWTASLGNFAFEHIGNMPVAAIDTPDVLRVLQPIWTTKTTTATRVRGRIEKILDWAKVHGLRNGGENPARWTGHLDHLFPKKSKVTTVEHFDAVPVAAVPSFMEGLRAQRSNS
jgi:Arm DNA-binding domain